MCIVFPPCAALSQITVYYVVTPPFCCCESGSWFSTCVKDNSCCLPAEMVVNGTFLIFAPEEQNFENRAKIYKLPHHSK